MLKVQKKLVLQKHSLHLRSADELTGLAQPPDNIDENNFRGIKLSLQLIAGKLKKEKSPWLLQHAIY